MRRTDVVGMVFAAALTAACSHTATPTAGLTNTVIAGGDVARFPRAEAAIRDSVKQVLDRAERDSAFPGAIAVVGTRDRVITHYAVGHLDWAPSPAPDERTLWDLASLTKVIGLTSGIMQLVAQGRISLD